MGNLDFALLLLMLGNAHTQDVDLGGSAVPGMNDEAADEIAIQTEVERCQIS